MDKNKKKYIHYGCGLKAPATWINYDASPTLRIQRIPILGGILSINRVKFPSNVLYGDIVKGLPITSESCDAIYCSHVLEHLALDEFRIALRNTYSYLKPNGYFRLVVPDLKQLVRQYLNSNDPCASHRFLKASRLGRETYKLSPIQKVIETFGRSGKHLWMWDFESMSFELEGAGFNNIRLAAIGDCPEIKFEDVEEETRWQQGFGVESRK